MSLRKAANYDPILWYSFVDKVMDKTLHITYSLYHAFLVLWIVKLRTLRWKG
jgi:hypothetical protein